MSIMRKYWDNYIDFVCLLSAGGFLPMSTSELDDYKVV